MSELMKAFFWLCLVVVVYAYFGYPVALIFLRIFIRRPVKKQLLTSDEALPLVSVVVPAYNEGALIADKIRNVRSLNYPAKKMELLIASDGSTDNTVEAAMALADGPRVRVLAFPQNRGKMSVLNDAAREAGGEIVLFSDAVAMLEPESVRQLAANFADPEVGAVSGTYQILKGSESSQGAQERIYWKYEAFLKVQESLLASVVGGHGHILAVRKELYPYPASETINDDFVIPVRILASGKRVIYEPQAITYEKAEEMEGFGRRVRIFAGNVQQMGELKGLLRPLQILPAFFFLSHKVVRSMVPFFLMGMLVSNLFLLDEPLFRITGCLQAGFYFLALAGSQWQLKPRALRLPYYFCFVNGAYLWSFLQSTRGARKVKWE